MEDIKENIVTEPATEEVVAEQVTDIPAEIKAEEIKTEEEAIA